MAGLSLPELGPGHKPYTLGLVFILCGLLLSSVNRAGDGAREAVGERREASWVRELRALGLNDSRLVLPGEEEYGRVVKVSQSSH